MNAAIEIHDSHLTGIEKRGAVLEVHLSAYIHKSEGEPGVDRGTGWTQDAILAFADGVVEGLPKSWPVDLGDGELRWEGQTRHNVIPIPFQSTGSVSLTLRPMWDFDHPIVASGSSVQLQLKGTARYIEDFPGSR